MKAKLKTTFILLCCMFLLACYSGMEASSQKDDFSKRVSSNITTAHSPVASQDYQYSCEERLQQARILSIKGELENAINEYKKLIEQGCDTSGSRINFGLALAEAGRWDEAVEQYRIIVKRDPKDWAAHWTLAQTLILELGQYEEGLKEVKAARELDDMGDVGYNYDFFIGKALDGLRRYEEAVTYYDIYIKAQSKVWKNEPRLIEAKERVSVIKGK